jgi:hypothetical protein
MAKRRSGTPTLEEVAVHAGVGRGTVSRVIDNAAGVKESTRRAVQRAVEELGYVPNLAARSLAGQRADAGRRLRLTASLASNRHQARAVRSPLPCGPSPWPRMDSWQGTRARLR